MAKSILVFILMIHCLTGRCQVSNINKLQSIQGVWEGTANSEAENLYKVVAGNKSLGISFTSNSTTSSFYLLESIEGFQSYKYGEVDSINIKWLSEGGRYYTSIVYEDEINEDGWVSIIYCIIPEYFECDGELMSIGGTGLIEFAKINELPQAALKLLFHRGILDGRNYVKEYLDLKVMAIKPLKCIVYFEPDKQANVRLNKDDVVIITEEAGKWLKVKYGETGIGWIKKEDVK